MTEARLPGKGRQSTLDYMASRESLKEGGVGVIMMFQKLEDPETRRMEWRDGGLIWMNQMGRRGRNGESLFSFRCVTLAT